MEFLDALRHFDSSVKNLVIPDIKCFSPKEGDLIGRRNPAELAQQLVAAGAPVLSVVTEEKEFHGSAAMLREICSTVNVPVLRKDFIQTHEDLLETVDCGAKAILLMYSCLGKQRMHELYADAVQLGLTPFVETHTEQELLWAAELHAELIGINNRDILQLERDDGSISRTKQLLTLVPKDSFVISESSIRNANEVRQIIKCGANGVLIGTAILQAENAIQQYCLLTQKVGVKICGFMSANDIIVCGKKGVDFIGFVVDYPVSVPWRLTREQAKPLISLAKTYADTAIVTGGDCEKVLELAKMLRPNYIQLHHKESFAESAHIAKMLKPYHIGVIRNIPTQENERRKMFGTPDLKEIVEQINNSEIYGILFDSRTADNANTSGECINNKTPLHYDIAQAIPFSYKQVFVAGGIDSSNANTAIALYHPDYIDIMTGIEDAPGIKSPSKLQALLDKTRA